MTTFSCSISLCAPTPGPVPVGFGRQLRVQVGGSHTPDGFKSGLRPTGRVRRQRHDSGGRRPVIATSHLALGVELAFLSSPRSLGLSAALLLPAGLSSGVRSRVGGGRRGGALNCEAPTRDRRPGMTNSGAGRALNDERALRLLTWLPLRSPAHCLGGELDSRRRQRRQRPTRPPPRGSRLGEQIRALDRRQAQLRGRRAHEPAHGPLTAQWFAQPSGAGECSSHGSHPTVDRSYLKRIRPPHYRRPRIRASKSSSHWLMAGRLAG